MDRNNHHSDLAVDSRTKVLKVSVTTHSAGAITQADVDFARALNAT
jgi:pterin-4a-carbinolamine dehydratase